MTFPAIGELPLTYRAIVSDILLKHRSGDTVCGWVKNIGREGQEHRLLTLEELREEQVDMFTTVFIGSQSTREISGRMVTPRGYEAKG